MSITIRYFASLKEYIGRSEDHIDLHNPTPVEQIWQMMNPDQSMPENTLIAVNMEYVNNHYHAQDGDEIAFFPPVTGG